MQCNVTKVTSNYAQTQHWYSKFIGYLIYEYDAQNIVHLKAFLKKCRIFIFLNTRTYETNKN
jgi:hypothetical protein